MEGKSLTEYGASYHAWDEKEKVVRGLLAAMDALYEKGILENDLSSDNITIMPDFSIRMAGVERVGDRAAEALDGKDTARGFCNTDKNPKTIAHYIYTQRFYDSQGNVQFTDETGQSTCYDYGTGAVGTMRAILFADGYVYDRLYMLGDLRK